MSYGKKAFTIYAAHPFAGQPSKALLVIFSHTPMRVLISNDYCDNQRIGFIIS